MADMTYPKGSLVKLRSGGPVMNVFGARPKGGENPMMPKDLKEGLADDGGEWRRCFWLDRSDQPVLVEIPVECLEPASQFDTDKIG